MKWSFLLPICPLLVSSFSLFAQPAAVKPEIWLMPPMDPTTAPVKELFTQPDAWKETRSHVQVLGFADWRLSKDYTDEELGQWLPMIKKWGIKFALEVGAVKPWGKTGAAAFTAGRVYWDRFEKLGGKIDVMALDEPLCCCKFEFKHTDNKYAVEETANFIALVRQQYPQMQIGDIEGYPTVSYKELTEWIDALQAKLKEKNVRGIDFFRLDVNWTNLVAANCPGSWPEVKALENFCRSRGIPFSMVYWAADYQNHQAQGLSDDSTWYVGLMRTGYDYALVGGKPDQVVVQSWVGAPTHSTPETDPWTFTRSALDFYKKFAK